MPNLLLGVTGSVAAIYTPELTADLAASGFQVKVLTTRAGEYFFDAARVTSVDTGGALPGFIRDEDEWPGLGRGGLYQRGQPVLHIELRRWADILLIAPLSANTLGKLAHGLVDNCLTSVWRAWDRDRPLVLAPAMNTYMWDHPATARHLGQIASDLGAAPPPAKAPQDTLVWINENCPRLHIVSPISKRLACDDVGMGALAERPEILRAVRQTCGLAS